MGIPCVYAFLDDVIGEQHKMKPNGHKNEREIQSHHLDPWNIVIFSFSNSFVEKQRPWQSVSVLLFTHHMIWLETLNVDDTILEPPLLFFVAVPFGIEGGRRHMCTMNTGCKRGR